MLRPIPPRTLSTRYLPAIVPSLGRSLGLDPERHPSAAFITCDQDHSLYVALDEATKQAPVDVVYARSLYAGRAHAPGPFSGEIMGVLAGPDPDCVDEGLKACIRCLEEGPRFYAADSDPRLLFFPHVVSQLGSYLSKEAGLEPGESMAYLMAPPLEAMIALDAALKTADVQLARTFPPPTATNFGGAFLSGELHECEAAAAAFEAAILEIAAAPRRERF